ncbi:hypothetical protein MTO96_001336 [Rhipicephalus appendiculatus]
MQISRGADHRCEAATASSALELLEEERGGRRDQILRFTEFAYRAAPANEGAAYGDNGAAGARPWRREEERGGNEFAKRSAGSQVPAMCEGRNCSSRPEPCEDLPEGFRLEKATQLREAAKHAPVDRPGAHDSSGRRADLLRRALVKSCSPHRTTRGWHSVSEIGVDLERLQDDGGGSR